IEAPTSTSITPTSWNKFITYNMVAITLISVSLAALLSCVGATNITTGALGNATIISNNPPGVVYVATLPTKEFNNPEDPRGNIKGSVAATANPNGIGVSISVSFSNLPTSGGPFLYHIHEAPVPADGNCTSTGAHLDPFVRGETPACDSSLPQTCQVGDLSGKHGKIESDPFVATYSDDFASTVQGLSSFFGNLSFVVHFANKTRITCANFALAGSLPPPSGSNSSCSANSTTSIAGAGSSTSPTTGTGAPQFTGAGAKTVAPIGSLLGVAALAFFF
ncbi:Cell surface Cu-only superoxide dismutase, partial [Lachnellula occidentalis]